MLKRFITASVLLVVLSACNSMSPAQPAPSTAPTLVAQSTTTTPVAPTASVFATPTVEPTSTPAPDKPAIWLLDSIDQQVAVDPQTGQALNQLNRVGAS